MELPPHFQPEMLDNPTLAETLRTVAIINRQAALDMDLHLTRIQSYLNHYAQL